MFCYDVKTSIPAALTDPVNNGDLKRELTICRQIPELSVKRTNKIIINYFVRRRLSPQMHQLLDPPLKFHSVILSAKYNFSNGSYISTGVANAVMHRTKVC